MIPLDLAPARWIWLPSQRTLPSTFALFRREIFLDDEPRLASGWIAADSRYRVWVNGERVQSGPAPCDPRAQEADPLDISAFLRRGPNIIGIEVLYYGHGDGTSAISWPGLLLRLDIEEKSGGKQQLVSDKNWACCLDRAREPGTPPRWFLRALQERFDARIHPHGWATQSFVPDARWMPAQELPGRADKPSGCAGHPNYLNDAAVSPDDGVLLQRDVALLREEPIAAKGLRVAWGIQWQRDPRDWFDFFLPDSFEVGEKIELAHTGDGWVVPTSGKGEAHLLSFEWPEQIVGFPLLEIEAPEGTIVEIIPLEAHDADALPTLFTPFFGWSRLVCREGANEFLPIEYESLRWLQLHVRGNARPVTIRRVEVLRRLAPWPQTPRIESDDPALQRLFDATLNMLCNCAQETIVDGMARERQQYSGDCGHQLHALRTAFGETRIPRRFLRTWSQGQTLDGFFLDCWPGYDRFCRVMQRQIGATRWGPILDHGVGFSFDCWNHFLETGDQEAVAVPFARLQKFVAYLESIRQADGLVPVEHLGVPSVWIDHDAYEQQRHKACAFNLYIAAMLRDALSPLSRALGDEQGAHQLQSLGDEILAATQAKFWSNERELFVANLPWMGEEGALRLCDRSLATALLFDLCPDGQTKNALQTLADCPPAMGFSYPANAVWRLSALARFGRADVVLRELREKWATLPSVVLNNTLQEEWHATPDSNSQWSHCPVAPLNVLFMEIAGIKPLAPGFSRVSIAPQLGDLNQLSLTAHTPRGPIQFSACRDESGQSHHLEIELPDGMSGELHLRDANGHKRKVEVARRAEATIFGG